MNDCYYKKITDATTKNTFSEDIAETKDAHVKAIAFDSPPKCSIVLDEEDPYKPWDGSADLDISPDINPHQDPLKGSSKAFLAYRIVNLIYWTGEMGFLIYFKAFGNDSKNLLETGFLATFIAT